MMIRHMYAILFMRIGIKLYLNFIIYAGIKLDFYKDV